ncbi:hypothetical protein GCM10009678_21130 [Actinomadura kijaniata]|uniref:bifunctional serine/threonine-protein kinase/ABC transporter substrate-binding protein n=1 Tax=Actinomadura kijaniata TaxID=46161 RepID=UPI002FEBD447
MPEPLSPDDPTRVGGYELTGRLGDGGQGSVYLGRDAAGRTVAVKLLHARLGRDPAARARFVRELEVAERVSGFCTARVLDADIDGDRPYIVSEFVDGPSLADLVRRDGPLDAAALTRLAIGTATALAAIHRAGIVHRDFKPPNVLVGPGGPRVIDFGIARALDSEAITVTSQVVGTPAFMAPEQIAGGRVGPAADVFAWGATMLFAATGRQPFGGGSIPAVMHAVLHAEADLNAPPGPLAEIVASCLAKDPARRPSSAEVLTRLLGAVGAQDPGDPQDGDPLERGATLVYSPPADLAFAPSTRPTPSTRPPRRRTRAVALSALAAALVTALPPTLWALRDTGGEGPGGGTAKTVRVAFIGPLSKGVTDLSPLGTAMRDGAKAAVQAHNRRNPSIKAELVEYDTKGDAALAEAAARQAVERKVVAVIGPSLSEESRRAVPVLERAGIPSVSPAAANATLVEQGWRTWHAVVPDVKVAATALADLAVTKGGAKKVVVVEDETHDAMIIANHAVAKLSLAGAKPTRVRTRSRSDHADAVKKIKESGADAVVYGGFYPAAAPLVKRARAARVTARFYLSDGALDEEFVRAAGTREAEGTVFTCSCLIPGPKAPADQRYARFRDAFRAVHGTEPRPYAAEGHDAAGALLATLAPRRDDPRAINEALRTVDYTGGVAPRVRFNDKGEIIDGVAHAYQVHNGVITLLGDAGKASIN